MAHGGNEPLISESVRISEREAVRRAFLADAGLGDARREPLAGDASTRAYERLRPARGPSLIFMDQPPAIESHPCPPAATAGEREALGYNALARLAAGRVEAFVACAAYLRGRGLSAPQVLAADPPAGLAVLEDLGDDLYAALIAAGADEGPLYDNAVDTLLSLHQATPPAVLTGDGALLAAAHLRRRRPAHRGRSLPRVVAEARAASRILGPPPEGTGMRSGRRSPSGARRAPRSSAIAITTPRICYGCRRGRGSRGRACWTSRTPSAPIRPGIFRCCCTTPGGMSQPEREAAALARYLAARPDLDARQFMADYHALGALNVLRILGMFARLVVRDGKPRYRGLMGRLWRGLGRCLDDPAPVGLRAWLDGNVPEEVRA